MPTFHPAALLRDDTKKGVIIDGAYQMGVYSFYDVFQLLKPNFHSYETCIYHCAAGSVRLGDARAVHPSGI